MKKYLKLKSFAGLVGVFSIFIICVPLASAQQDPRTKDPFVKKKAGATTAAVAEVKEAPATFNIVIEVEHINVPKARLIVYAKDHGIETDATALRKEVQTWITAGEASVMESSLLITRSGQRAKVSSVRECIYPTEWQASGVPASFETRNEGTTLEVDPVSNSDGSQIDLNIAPEVVTHVGETPALPEPKWFKEGDFHIPHFISLAGNSAVSSTPEHYTLLNTKPSHENADKRSILTFVRCGRSPVIIKQKDERPIGLQMNFSFEWIEVATAEFSKWAFEQKLAEIPGAAYEAAQSWIQNGTASVGEVTSLQARSGQRAKSESISEVIYYAEVEENDQGVVSPTAFETRHQGSIVEAEAYFLEDRNFSDLQIAPEAVKLVGKSVLHRTSEGEPDVMMPLFYTMRFTSAVTICEKQPTLLAVMTPPNEAGQSDRSRKLLFFVTSKR